MRRRSKSAFKGGDEATARGAYVCVRTIYWMAFWQLEELGVMTDEEAITEAAESMLGSWRRSDGVFTAESRAIKVSDYQVTWDWDGNVQFCGVDVQA